jgi:aspartate/methionine/tyrosine aminotransferase
MKKFDLAWGESVAVRHAFLSVSTNTVTFDPAALSQLNYPVYEGDPALVELTKKVIKRQTGYDYKHVLITNGATGGVTIALRTFKSMGKSTCYTGRPPYFRLYPGMVKASGLEHRHVHSDIAEDMKDNGLDGDRVYLVDSMSNPLAQFPQLVKGPWSAPVVWDAVYFSRVYCPGTHFRPDHDVIVGSYSKLTGMNGVRTGWIATNDTLLYERMKQMVISEYCGVSVPSTKIVMETAGSFSNSDWERFEKKAQSNLDENRTEWSKLEKFLGETPVSKYGMFHYAPIDSTCKKLLEKSGVVWVPGSHLGDSDEFGRFNVGQDMELVRKAVKEVLKNDKR